MGLDLRALSNGATCVGLRPRPGADHHAGQAFEARQFGNLDF
jgi:hypothetical protein